MENLTYKYIDNCISEYMGYERYKSLAPNEKYGAFIQFLKAHTQNVYSKSFIYNLKLNSLEFTNYSNINDFVSFNYNNYYSETKFTINIIAFQKKLIYYLIYIVSILCDYNEKDSIIVNICSDTETFNEHLTELQEIKKMMAHFISLGNPNDFPSKYTYKFNEMLNDNGPLITLIDRFIVISSYKETEILEYYYFIYKIMVYLSNTKINSLVINDELSKGIGMKRGIINYHNKCVGEILNDINFSSLVLDDNITHIIKPIYSDSDSTIDTPVYLSEDSETKIQCGMKLDKPTPTKSHFLNNIYGPPEEINENQTRYVDLSIPNPNFGFVLNNEIGLSHKLRLKESGFNRNINQQDPYSHGYLLAKYSYDGIDIYKDVVAKGQIKSGKKEAIEKDRKRIKANLCTWRSNARATVNKDTYNEDFSKCKNRYSILKMYKKLLLKMKNSDYLVGGIAKGANGMNDVENTVCGQNINAIYKLTLQKQCILWESNCVYNVFSSRYWEDIPFNSLVANKHINGARSRILKMHYGLRFGHFILFPHDNEDLFSTYINAKLYPNNYETNKKFLESIILNTGIKGIKEPHIITAYYQQILINSFYNAKVIFDFEDSNAEGDGKYAIYHKNTLELIRWFETKSYQEQIYDKYKVFFMNMEFNNKKYIDEIHNYQNYCCIDTNFSFIKTIGGNSLFLRLTLLNNTSKDIEDIFNGYKTGLKDEEHRYFEQIINPILAQLQLQNQKQEQAQNESIKKELAEKLTQYKEAYKQAQDVRQIYIEQLKQIYTKEEKYEEQLEQLQLQIKSYEELFHKNKDVQLQYQNFTQINQEFINLVQNYQQYLQVYEATKQQEEEYSYKLQEIEEYTEKYNEMLQQYQMYHEKHKEYYGFKKYKKYKDKYLKLKNL